MHDTTLDELCQKQPKTLAALRQISGIGEKKCEMYGEEILKAFERFRRGERASKEWHARPSNPSLETLDLLRQGRTLAEIAALRGRKISSVVALVADLIERGETEFQPNWMLPERRDQIRQACEKVGTEWLKPIKEALPEEVTYDEIRLAVAEFRRNNASAKPTSP
jgi:ATP-dependent DNA helicase RecQ